MKIIARIAAICLLLIPLCDVNAQETSVLKSFINENDVAVRSVQKYSLTINNSANEAELRELLKLQVASVRLFASDPKKSADIAYAVRQKCSAFLTKNSKGSLEYLQLSDKERRFFASPKPVGNGDPYLSPEEITKIGAVDTRDPHLFDHLNVRIQ